jgi:hypothetical protein
MVLKKCCVWLTGLDRKASMCHEEWIYQSASA